MRTWMLLALAVPLTVGCGGGAKSPSGNDASMNPGGDLAVHTSSDMGSASDMSVPKTGKITLTFKKAN